MNTKRLNNLLRNYAIDELYTSNKVLGPIYTKKSTKFNVWSPLASEINLIEYKENEKILHKMTKEKDAVFTITLKGNLDNFEYNYQVKFDEYINDDVVDPYAKATTANGKRSVVVDLKSTNPRNWIRLESFSSPTDAIIYELCVRDFSMDSSAKFKNRGKFLALTEKKSIKYLKSLGITHLQLLPIYDFSEESVDELNPYEKYNWGYDPVNYNVVEGSYSTDASIAKLRIKELKQTINTLHKNGIRVIMDVVYNHVYDAKKHSFDKLVPDYAFRFDENFDYSNGSACGNDVASERKMIRKYIVDSIVYWAKEYHLDGFRFDLMGILDIDTMKEIREKLNEIDKGIIILGEGWHLDTKLEEKMKSTQTNAEKLEGIAFFNDDIRDSLKGSSFEKLGLGFATNSGKKEKRLIDSIKGGKGLYTYKSPSQVVQYVEAHDNYTLYDQISITRKDETENNRIKMNKLSTSIILTSQGISFLHAGQEFLRTKFLDENSYKSSDEINMIRWSEIKKQRNYINYISSLISLRKNEKLFRLKTYEEIEQNLKILKHTKNLLVYELGKKYIIIANSSNNSKILKLNGKYNIICKNYKFLKENKEVKDKLNISPYNFIILKK